MKKLLTLITLGGAFFATTAALAQNAPGAALAPGAKYVALGSSFAAGPGVPEQLGACGRSDANYPHLVAAALGLTLTDVSCSGATTDHILNTPQGESPLQIDAVSSDTALVTVTIGGNDITFTSSTFACAGTAPSARCTANLDQAMINDAIERLPNKLSATLDAIKAKAPQALIVLVTYPRIFLPDAASCSELELSSEDIAYLAAMGQKLQDAFVNVVASRQALIADSYVRAAGHGPCEAAISDRWVNGNKIAASGIRYHPTAEGHVEMARLVVEALGRGN